MSTLPDSGPISLGQLQTEFGGSDPTGMSEYYRGGNEVPDTGATLNIPTTGNPLSLSNFYGTQDVQFRNVSFSFYKDTNQSSSGVGLTTASSTAAPSSFNTTTRQRFYQPVFRAGTNFITSLTFGLGYNEDCSTQADTIVFYGGTDSSNVTSPVYRWNTFQSNQGGGHTYTLTFNANGSISGIQYISGVHNTSIMSLQTPNVNSDHRWYGFGVIRPSSIGKAGSIINLSLANTLQPD